MENKIVTLQESPTELLKKTVVKDIPHLHVFGLLIRLQKMTNFP